MQEFREKEPGKHPKGQCEEFWESHDASAIDLLKESVNISLKVEKLVFFGDSITDWGRTRDQDPATALGDGYVRMIKNSLDGQSLQAQCEVVNRGVSGNGIQDLNWRFDSDVISENPDILSIAIGINDTLGRRLSNDEFKKEYGSLLDRARTHNKEIKLIISEVYVVGSGPAGYGGMTNAEIVQDVKEKNAIIAELAEEHNATLVPLADKMSAIPDDTDLYFIPSQMDGYHPPISGHEIICKEWLKATKSIRGN